MATTNNDAFGAKGAEMIQPTDEEPHLPALTVGNGVRITWPFSNAFHASALSSTLRDRALEQLREAGIEATHATERDELLDIITGQPTGYVHCAEVFVVADADAPRAGQILQQTLDLVGPQGIEAIAVSPNPDGAVSIIGKVQRAG